MDSDAHLQEKGFHRDKRLLGLALDCHLIYPRKKEKIEAILAERAQDQGPVDVIDILLEEKVLTQDKADFLLALDAHTATRARDHLFGNLAVANRLVAQSDVDAALAFQKAAFNKDRTHLRIGDILQERGLLTQAHCTAILLTQNRIKAEDLLAAMDSLGQDPAEKETINKRFGVIAAKKGLVTMEQVIEALKCQKTEAAETQTPRFLGAILSDLAGLSSGDVATVLMEQRQMEVRRLDLQKALYSVKSELKIFQRLNKWFAYTLTRDGIEAVAKKRRALTEPVLVYELIIWLRKAGICFGILNDDILETFIKEAPPGKDVLLARGYGPEQGQPPEIRFYFEAGPKVPLPSPPEAFSPEPAEVPGSPEPPVPEKTAAPEGPVTQGDLLAQLIPAREGKPGKNVLGHAVFPEKPPALTLFAGKGVTRKGNDFLAVADGFPRLTENATLVVEPHAASEKARNLTQDIREDTADRYLDTDLTVRGSLLAQGAVQCGHLTLAGDFLGQARCTGDITIEGSLGKAPDPKTEPPPAQAVCNGSIRVAKFVAHARAVCGGSFWAVNAAAVSTRVCAAKGLTVKEALGSALGPTVLRAGIGPDDPLLAIDQTLEVKSLELAALRKETEMDLLSRTFETDMTKARHRQLEQEVFTALIRIIEGPELFQYPELRDKLEYLSGLPDYSSVKTYYLTIPPEASDIVQPFLTPGQKTSLDDQLRQLRGKLDPEPENSMPETQRLELEFNARMEALGQEAQADPEAVAQLEREVTNLQAARTKLGRAYVKTMAPGDFPVIRIRNRCDKGTVIQGILAAWTATDTVYNVRFREKPVPGTRQTVMAIEG